MTVADATPLISLARIRAFSLLKDLFGRDRLVIPPAVYGDVVTKGNGRPGEAEVQAGLVAGWMDVLTPSQLFSTPSGSMHRGEIEAVSLAQEFFAELLIDEGPGRRHAAQLGLAIYGTLDVLLLAKAEGHTDAVKPYLEALRAAGFFFTPELYAIVLQKAGE